MTSITDRELLAFCSLAKLKLEFSQYKKEKDNPDGTKRNEYYTIRQLIDLELAGQKNKEERDKLKSDKSSKTPEEYQKDINNMKNSNKLGVFYKIDDDNNVTFQYESSDSLRHTSPMLMELYDKKERKESEFLDKWQIEYVGDYYTLNERTFREFITKNEPALDERKKKLEKIPTRTQIENFEKDKKEFEIEIAELTRLLYILQAALIPVGSEALAPILSRYPQMVQVLIIFLVNKIQDADYLVAYTFEKDLRKELLSVLLSIGTEKSKAEEFLDEIMESRYTMKFKFKENGVKIILLKNIDSGEYVLALEDTEKLSSIETQLNSGEIPEEVMILTSIMKSFKEEKLEKKEKFIPIITGIDNAGKLATVLGIMSSSKSENSKIMYPIRCFYNEEPVNLATLPFFKTNDLNAIFKKQLMNGAWEIIPKISKNVSEYAEFFISGAVYSHLIGFSGAGVLAQGLTIPGLVVLILSVYLPTLDNFLNASNREVIMDTLYDEEIILGKTIGTIVSSTINKVSFGKIGDKEVGIGLVNPENLGDKKIQLEDNSFQNLDLASYIQIKYYQKRYKLGTGMRIDSETIEFTGSYDGQDSSSNYLSNPHLSLKELKESEYIEKIGIDEYLKSGRILNEYRFQVKIEKGIIKKSKLTRINANVISEGTQISKYNIISLENEETFSLLVDLLLIFKNIQENIKDIELDAYYLENEVPTKIESLVDLSYSAQWQNGKNAINSVIEIPLILWEKIQEIGVPEENIKKAKKINEYSYFPYISNGSDGGDDGKITENIREEYIGSFLRSIHGYSEVYDKYAHKKDGENNIKTKNFRKYFNLEEKLLFIENFAFTESNSKGDVINSYLREKIERKGKKMLHYKAVIRRLNKTKNKELEKFYEIFIREKENTEPNKRSGSRKMGYLHIGNLKSDNKDEFNKEVLSYSYNIEDGILSRGIILPLFYDETSDEIQKIQTTMVLDGASLKCSEGIKPLILKVISQKRHTINKKLVATIEDCGKESVNGYLLGKSCMVNKEHPEKCEYISIGPWTGGSDGETIDGKLILLNNGKLKCAKGGEIEIKDSKCIVKSN